MGARKRRNQDGVPISRTGQRLLGFGTAVVGLVMLFVGAFSAMAEVRRAPTWVPRSGYLQGECTVESADVERVTNNQGDDETTVAARFTLRAGGRSHPGLRYRYPTHFVGSEQAARSLIERELRPGAPHACWYNPRDPADAALVRYTGPDAPPSPWAGVIVAVVGAALLAAGVAFARSKRRWYAGSAGD